MADVETKVMKKDAKKRMVKALFSYTPENFDELPLKVNDILEVIEETEEGWWKGILDGNVGMFPSNFVIELDGLPEEFNNHLMNELSPTKSVIKVKNVGHQEPMHRHGCNHSPSSKQDGKQGTLNSGNEDDGQGAPKRPPEPAEKKTPTSSKKVIDSPAPRLPPKPVREQARVMFPYVAQNEDELTLKEGDVITVISKEIEDKGWWKGELNNRVGVFPDNFVQLIKVEEQKKPERPDKPSTAIPSKSNIKSNLSDKSCAESSPRTDKKAMKTPPMKPPPPEIHKKEPDRPLPPYPSKKPQLPHPIKKPVRSSLGTKLPGFPSVPVNSLRSPVTESSPSTISSLPASEVKTEDGTKSIEKSVEKTEKQDKKDDLGFDAVESSEKKLVHLTAKRVKAPNRRPPSHIFLKENEKENGFSTDPRRLSEPLLSEMKSLLPVGDIESQKTTILPNSEVKPKVPPSRPSPPNIKSSKPVAQLQGSVSLVTKSFYASDESILKAPEAKRISVSDGSPNITGNEIVQPKVFDFASDMTANWQSTEELCDKDSLKILSSVVSRNDYNELLRQVKELKEVMEKYNDSCNKAICDLKEELEEEKKLRRALETELRLLKERQTT